MPDDLTFPKRRPLKMGIDPSADNFPEQLVAAVGRIEEGIRSIDDLLQVLVAVLTEEEEAKPPAPRLVVPESEHRAGPVPVDARD
jgi:hypothetical protein